MLNSNFYNDPETLNFIASTRKELEEFKAINLNIAPDPTPATETKTEDIGQSDNVREIKEFLDKNVEYNEKVEKAKKKVYSNGYRKPPKKYQFKKGQSGNPKGRPPEKHSFTLYDSIYKSLYKEVVVAQNGKKEKISLLEVFGESVTRDAIKKDGPSRRFLLQNIQIMRHNFMEPLIEEAIDKIQGKVGLEASEKAKKAIFEFIAGLDEKDERQ